MAMEGAATEEAERAVAAVTGVAARAEVVRVAAVRAVAVKVAVREALAAARAISAPARTCPDGSLPQTTRATAPDPAPATRTSVHRLRWRESSARYALTTRHRARECES